ncbi:MAG: GIY-YIG nuclease family protein [Saccharospirillaceae bacterium]|nr:GIY-YIG nuclease family protein [Pseudomonadales bacterium]NRB81440.1 GIY-YIG nuclease family protein [Saccharospirillaceae bacterium]
MKQPAIYIMTNKRNGTLYTGVTGNLIQRIWQHKNDVIQGFSKKYQTHNLVYFEMIENFESAITREKQIKKYSRKRKMELIEKSNPYWKDLYGDII